MEWSKEFRRHKIETTASLKTHEKWWEGASARKPINKNMLSTIYLAMKRISHAFFKYTSLISTLGIPRKWRGMRVWCLTFYRTEEEETFSGPIFSLLKPSTNNLLGRPDFLSLFIPTSTTKSSKVWLSTFKPTLTMNLTVRCRFKIIVVTMSRIGRAQ